MEDETAPLLGDHIPSDPYEQFCLLIGISPSEKPDARYKHSSDGTLYTRATRKHRAQNMTYGFTAALSNTLLLSQVVLGATLTALGASESSHVLITIFGVLNTIIAGLVAYLKSRGQPMRARMFRDDLEHVVEEIENSKTMWLGIKDKVHGYDEIDIDDKVSVRSEVARLTRLYESAVKKYMQNNPDMYSMGGGLLDAITGLRARPGAGVQLPPAPPATTVPNTEGAAAPGPAPMTAPPPAGDADESPATAKGDVKSDAKSKDKAGQVGTDKQAQQAPAAKDNTSDSSVIETPKGKTEDADEEPASARSSVKKHEDDSGSVNDVNGHAKASR